MTRSGQRDAAAHQWVLPIAFGRDVLPRVQTDQQVGPTGVGVAKLLIRQKEPMRGQVQHTRGLRRFQLRFPRLRAETQDGVIAEQFGDFCCLHARPGQRFEFEPAIIVARYPSRRRRKETHFNFRLKFVGWEANWPAQPQAVKVICDRTAAEMRVVGTWNGRSFEQNFPFEPDLPAALKRAREFIREQTGQ